MTGFAPRRVSHFKELGQLGPQYMFENYEPRIAIPDLTIT